MTGQSASRSFGQIFLAVLPGAFREVPCASGHADLAPVRSSQIIQISLHGLVFCIGAHSMSGCHIVAVVPESDPKGLTFGESQGDRSGRAQPTRHRLVRRRASGAHAVRLAPGRRVADLPRAVRTVTEAPAAFYGRYGPRRPARGAARRFGLHVEQAQIPVRRAVWSGGTRVG